MSDFNLPEGFEELNSDAMESVEGGFIFNALLGVTSNVFRSVTGSTAIDDCPVIAPVADLLDRKAETILGTVTSIAGSFLERRANANRSW